MVVTGLAPGFLSRFADTDFQNALERGGQSNTDRSRIGSTPARKDIQNTDATALNPGRTRNASQTMNTEAAGVLGASGVVNPTADGMFGATIGEGGQDERPAHYHDQYLGQSIRAPMTSEGKPSQEDESKNIFFKFRGEENAEVPGIWMFVNPSQLTINMTKKLPEQVTRGGHVIFHWGDNLDEINASGITGSFARPDCQKGDASTHNGIERYTGAEPDFGLDRRDTWPYWRFMQLLALYRNNGITSRFVDESKLQTGGFDNSSRALASAISEQSSGPPINKTGTLNNLANATTSGTAAANRTERPVFAGVEMHYDDQVFTGYFSALTWTERADDPFKFTIDFRFTVLNTQYNKVFERVAPGIKPQSQSVEKNLLANFQIPRFNTL